MVLDSSVTVAASSSSSSNGSSASPSAGGRHLYKTPEGTTIEIRDVWASNLADEMDNIREILSQYPYVSMDTEFPGVVARPVGDFGASDLQYQTLRCNIDMLKIIQLGLSFSDGSGNWAEGCACWQFNFKFSLSEDMYAEDSIELLKVCALPLPCTPCCVTSPPHYLPPCWSPRHLGSTFHGSRRTALMRTCSAS